MNRLPETAQPYQIEPAFRRGEWSTIVAKHPLCNTAGFVGTFRLDRRVENGFERTGNFLDRPQRETGADFCACQPRGLENELDSSRN